MQESIKPQVLCAICGTTEVVPCYKTIYAASSSTLHQAVAQANGMIHYSIHVCRRTLGCLSLMIRGAQ
jgi:hypothetical protein